MKASVLKVLASLLAVGWICTGCAIFQQTPPAGTQLAASATAPTQTSSVASGGTDLAAAEPAVELEAAAPAEKPNRLRAVVDRIVAAVRGDTPAEVGSSAASGSDSSAAVDTVVEAGEESDAAGITGESVTDALPAVGASSVQSEVLEEAPKDWVLLYGLPILAGLLVLHFVTRLTGNRDAA